MVLKQFEDKNLSHYSYAICDGGEVILVDPARDPAPYHAFASEQQARITGVIETHPHADFVSSHLEIHRESGAVIYASRLAGALYPHQPVEDGDELRVGSCTLRILHTPGHSPDSICVVIADGEGEIKGLFTGDTLFFGDCGRPDLRESAGAVHAGREELAKDMYYSLRDRILPLPDHTEVYPAHGAGSLCGKGLSARNAGTLGEEKATNWSLGEMTEADFVLALLSDQPFVPKYFPHDVELNKQGASGFRESTASVPRRPAPVTCEGCVRSVSRDIPVVDARPQDEYKKAHLPNSINLMEDTRFETWLGSIISPGEPFYLAVSGPGQQERLIERIAKIGYEAQIKQAFSILFGTQSLAPLDLEAFREDPSAYTVVDVRNPSELAGGTLFSGAVHIPLYELRERVSEIPADKPVVVHCAAGYRSAAAVGIIASALSGTEVFDLGEAVKGFAAKAVA